MWTVTRWPRSRARPERSLRADLQESRTTGQPSEALLEELVGEIADEYDREEPQMQLVREDCYRVNGRISIDDLNRLLCARLPRPPPSRRCEGLARVQAADRIGEERSEAHPLERHAGVRAHGDAVGGDEAADRKARGGAPRPARRGARG